MSNWITPKIEDFVDGLEYWYMSERSHRFGMMDFSNNKPIDIHSETYRIAWIKKVFKTGFPECYNDYSLRQIKELIKQDKIKIRYEEA